MTYGYAKMPAGLIATLLFVWCNVPALRAQQETTPRFEVTDIQPSINTTHRFTEILSQRNPPDGSLRAGGYSLRRATLLDLIRIAYTTDANRILGGPGWLESTRFDIAAKAPPSTPPEILRLMLQDVLVSRFKLVLHQDVRPMPAFVLRVGKGKLTLNRANGSGNTGCGFQAWRDFGDVSVSCRNVTMKDFGEWLYEALGDYTTSSVLDETALKGLWNFEWRWRAAWNRERAVPQRAMLEALDKQTGLKLDLEKVATPVLVIDGVNKVPTRNPPEVGNLLPNVPNRFEVAAIKPSNPEETAAPRFHFDSGGQSEIRNMTLNQLISTAWDLPYGPTFVDAPEWTESARFDIVAKSAVGKMSLVDIDFRLMLRTLLIDRFKILTHYEDRLVPAYTLVAKRPRLKKADPLNRSSCKDRTVIDVNPKLPRLIVCQNTTMAQFADQLRGLALDYTRYADIADGTGIKGSWDFSVNFSSAALLDAGGGDDLRPPTDSPRDPGGGISLFDALEKQLGLKLEMRKRRLPVLVIDHIEQKPAEN